jgi:uncharacterized protein YdgA (DUF945 family)
MKRWVVGLLVFLAVIILISPGIVGRLAEKNLKNSISWAEAENDDFRVTEEKFDRRWFTAEGRHRIELKHGELRSSIVDLTGREPGDEVPALIVDTRIDHGLVPVTSLSRDSGSLMPGLASTVSTLHLDPGDGDLIPVPGTLYSQVRLTGATASRYLLEPGSIDEEEFGIDWEGADVSMTTDSSRRSLRYRGQVKPMSARTADASFALGLTNVEGDSRYTDYGLMVGAIDLDIESMSMRGGAGEEITTGSIRIEASNEVVDDRVNGNTQMTIADVSIPGFGDVDLSMDISATGLDARSLQAIVAEFENAQSAPDPDAAMAALYPQIETDLRTLLSAGAELRIDRFDVTLPQGEVTTKLSFRLPATDAAAGFSWAALVLALTASADLRVPVTLMELAQTVNPQSGALIAMGILKKDGDSYIVNAEYEKGLLTVNGAPMPIPLPGQ